MFCEYDGVSVQNGESLSVRGESDEAPRTVSPSTNWNSRSLGRVATSQSRESLCGG